MATLTTEDLHRIETELTILLYTAEGTLRTRDDAAVNPVAVQNTSMEVN